MKMKDVVIPPASQRAPKTLYINRSLLFSAAGCAEHKLDMNLTSSEKKGEMYVHRTLGRRKIGIFCWTQKPVQVRTIRKQDISRIREERAYGLFLPY